MTTCNKTLLAFSLVILAVAVVLGVQASRLRDEVRSLSVQTAELTATAEALARERDSAVRRTAVVEADLLATQKSLGDLVGGPPDFGASSNRRAPNDAEWRRAYTGLQSIMSLLKEQVELSDAANTSLKAEKARLEDENLLLRQNAQRREVEMKMIDELFKKRP